MVATEAPSPVAKKMVPLASALSWRSVILMLKE